MGEYKKGLERHTSSLMEKENLDETLGRYKEYTTYQYMMNSKVIEGTRTLKDFKFCESYYDFILENDSQLIEQQLEKLQQAEKKGALNSTQQERKEKLLKNQKKRNGKPLTVYDLFQAAIYGEAGNAQYNDFDGKTLYASSEEKRKLIEVCSKLTMEGPKKEQGEDSKTFKKRKQQFENANNYLIECMDQQFLKFFKGMNFFSVGNYAGRVYEDLELLKEERKSAENAYNVVNEKLQKKIKSIAIIQNKKEEYGKKLNLLAENADKAIEKNNFKAEQAKTAIHILTTDYIGKMKDGKEVLTLLSSDDESKTFVNSVMDEKKLMPPLVNSDY